MPPALTSSKKSKKHGQHSSFLFYFFAPPLQFFRFLTSPQYSLFLPDFSLLHLLHLPSSYLSKPEVMSVGQPIYEIHRRFRLIVRTRRQSSAVGFVCTPRTEHQRPEGDDKGSEDYNKKSENHRHHCPCSDNNKGHYTHGIHYETYYPHNHHNPNHHTDNHTRHDYHYQAQCLHGTLRGKRSVLLPPNQVCLRR